MNVKIFTGSLGITHIKIWKKKQEIRKKKQDSYC
jgi:hypothetical protein